MGLGGGTCVDCGCATSDPVVDDAHMQRGARFIVFGARTAYGCCWRRIHLPALGSASMLAWQTCLRLAGGYMAVALACGRRRAGVARLFQTTGIYRISRNQRQTIDAVVSR